MSAPFSARGWLLAAGFTAFAWLPVAAAAAPPAPAPERACFDPLPARLAAGADVELAWSELPGETEELELLLSLDDGRTFHVRVSPELEGATRHYRWRVPNLPAARARLCLRIGDRERDREAATSPCFEILGEPGVTPDLRQVHEGTWWSGFEPAGDGAAPGLAPDAPRATLAAATGDAVATPPRSPAVLEPRRTPVPHAALAAAAPLATPLESSRSRRFQPLRN